MDGAAPVQEPRIDGQAFLDHLAEAIRTPTVSHEDRERNDPGNVLAIHAFLRETYPLVHERCLVETVTGLSLLFTWQGTDAEADPIVLMAHMDVVPVESGTEAISTTGTRTRSAERPWTASCGAGEASMTRVRSLR